MEELLLEMIKYAADDYTENQEPFLESLIKNAIKESTRRRYELYTFRTPFEKKKAEDEVLLNYDDVILDIAKFHFDKQGKEGVVSFSENGVSVSYESAGTPQSYLDRIPILAKII